MPEDEYDTYLFGLASMIRGGASREHLLAYLEEVEQKHLMLSQPAGNKNSFIDAALAIVMSEGRA